jgi:glycine hydroxymethyltransferase
MHVIAAKAVCFGEALRPDFTVYQKQVVENARALAARLGDHGFRIVSGGTDNHSMLVDMRPLGLDGTVADAALDAAGITVNKNSIPFDTGSPMKPSGIRLGTPAVTTRGMKEADLESVADFMFAAIQNREDDQKLREIRERVFAFNHDFPLPE